MALSNNCGAMRRTASLSYDLELAVGGERASICR
jgi:hypothetical protein